MRNERRRAADEAAAVLAGRAARDCPLGARTTYRVGGPAAVLFEAHSPADLELAARAVRASGVPVLVVGRGSNLLVADAGFSGLAVVVGEGLGSIDVDLAGARVRAGGGASLPVLARRSASAGLGGLEWSVGVPGSVGGAVRMNAGGHGSDVSASLVRVGLCDLAGAGPRSCSGEVAAECLRLGYRTSAVGEAEVVVWAEFALAPRDRLAAEAEVAAIVAWRRANQPGGQNAGSVFTNPTDDSAGRLIETAGLKGMRHRSATVSAKHANFVQADAGGSADDVLALAREIQRRVDEIHGVRLELELRLVGFDEAAP